MVTDLAYALTIMQKTASVISPRFGIVNPNVLLNQIREYTVDGLHLRGKIFRESVANGPRGICIFPANSGVPRLADQSAYQRPTVLAKIFILGYYPYNLHVPKSIKYRKRRL